MFVAYVTAHCIDGTVARDVLATSPYPQSLKDYCDAEIHKDLPSGALFPSARWKTTGLTGYYKSVRIGEYSYFYTIVEVPHLGA